MCQTANLFNEGSNPFLVYSALSSAVEYTLDKRSVTGSTPVGPTDDLKYNMVEFIITIICALLAIAFFTIAERKLMASIQRRKGPNVTGFWGTLQAIADGLKLIFKEIVIPMRAN
jgi:hypothetical protein